MKRTLILLAACCTTACAGAQTTTGRVTYEETMKIEAPADLPAEAGPLKDFFASGMHSTRVLSFNPDASVYTTGKAEEKQMSGNTDDGMHIQFKMQIPEEVTYTDLKAGSVVEQRDLMGRKFLIAGDAAKRSWRMTGQQKTILAYPCQEAISYGKDTIIAWFTTAIPVSAGPQDWRGLPGLILEGSRVQQKGAFTIKATKVEQGQTIAIAPPKDGKKVTKAEFEAIEKEKAKEMQQQSGGRSHGGKDGMIIHIQN